MSDDLDSLLARLDARTQAFTGHHIDLEREAAAAIRELRDEPLGQRGDYWRDRAQEMERDLDAARAELLEHRAFFMAAEHKDGPKSIAEVLSGRLVAVEKERDAAWAEVERLQGELSKDEFSASWWRAGFRGANEKLKEALARAERAEALGRELAVVLTGVGTPKTPERYVEWREEVHAALARAKEALGE